MPCITFYGHRTLSLSPGEKFINEKVFYPEKPIFKADVNHIVSGRLKSNQSDPTKKLEVH